MNEGAAGAVMIFAALGVLLLMGWLAARDPKAAEENRRKVRARQRKLEKLYRMPKE